MSTPVAAKDIPKENLFKIGVIQLKTKNDGYHIAHPRRPFVISRVEALNVIGYIVCLGGLSPKEVDDAVNEADESSAFRLRGDEARVMIETPQAPFFLITVAEGFKLIGELARVMRLQPGEIDAAVMAVEDGSKGMTREDVAKNWS